MMNREILPGLFLEVTARDGSLVATRLAAKPAGSGISPAIDRLIDRFLDRWRRGIHEPLPDEIFLFPPALAKWAPLLLRLKNDIAPGMTVTYGELGVPLAIHPRTVGMVMARNPFPLLIPCHRVLGSGDRLTGFSAEGGIDTKRRLLAAEQNSR
ncbi:MAG TPA: MGMT family protein [bacterium]|nr:MGMT family protein [bacterium]